LLSEVDFDPLYAEKTKELRSQAEIDLLKAAESGKEEAFYPLACLYSLEKMHEVAMDYLYRAERAGSLPDNETLLHEVWLEEMHHISSFQEFLSNRHSQ
jgi:hypothetical protein